METPNALGENQPFLQFDDDDNVSELFQCCICLDLLYKPVVIECGHMCCFWCVHKAMSSYQTSHCPICRHPYYHFPSICWLLHSIIWKLCPVEYKRKEKQTLEEEKQNDCFSPQFKELLTTERVNPSSGPVSSERNNMGKNNNASEESALAVDGQASSMCKPVSIGDVLCVGCKQLLVRPVVLNCGHVYCESCVPMSKDQSIKCLECECLHPGGCPKVCLELDNFLAEQFPNKYTPRRAAVQTKSSSARAMSAEKGRLKLLMPPFDSDVSWLHENGAKVHFGVGCDTCGLYPIIGKRYRCLDCKEAIGFDLCEDCYNTRSKLPGRFNQQHTPEHRFELVQSNVIHGIVLSIMNDQSEDDSGASIMSTDTPEESGSRDTTM